MKQPTDWDEKMCGNLQHMFNILRMFEELDSGNELEEPESQNVHLKKKKGQQLRGCLCPQLMSYCFRPHWEVP